MGRPGALAPGVLRRQTDADPQGRGDCRQPDGRCQCLDPDTAASALSTDVRQLRRLIARHQPDFYQPGGAGRGDSPEPGFEEKDRRGQRLPRRAENRPDPQRLPATDRCRPADLPGQGRWRIAVVRAGGRAADGATLFPVLTAWLASEALSALRGTFAGKPYSYSTASSPDSADDMNL